MGAIAESIVAYAQPLIDETDGSIEEMQRALTLAQFCWNLAIMPEGLRNEALRDMQTSLKMGADEFEAFQRMVVVPMIQRHKEMFPHMPRLGSGRSPRRSLRAAPPSSTLPPLVKEKYPGTARNAPCPCNSGKKYKKCCGP